MVIPSNDAFWANDNPTAYPIFDGEGNLIPRSFRIYGSAVYDAGTEVNDEIGANTAFLAQAAPNTGTTERRKGSFQRRKERRKGSFRNSCN